MERARGGSRKGGGGREEGGGGGGRSKEEGRGREESGIIGIMECGLLINKTMNITGRIETPQQILNHPANTSSAKHHWSFSKASRFAAPKGYTATLSYDLPSSISRRKSGIGYGGRSRHF